MQLQRNIWINLDLISLNNLLFSVKILLSYLWTHDYTDYTLLYVNCKYIFTCSTSAWRSRPPPSRPRSPPRSWARCSSVKYSEVQHNTVQYSTVQYSIVQYSTVQYSTMQYSTAPAGQRVCPLWRGWRWRRAAGGAGTAPGRAAGTGSTCTVQ